MKQAECKPGVKICRMNWPPEVYGIVIDVMHGTVILDVPFKPEQSLRAAVSEIAYCDLVPVGELGNWVEWRDATNP